MGMVTEFEGGDVEFRFDSPSEIVSTLLGAASRTDLTQDLDYPGLHEELADWFVGFALASEGAVVEVSGSRPSEQELTSAHYLIPGTKIHVKLRSLSWRMALSLVPVVAGIIATGGVLLPLLGAVPLATVVGDAVTALSDDDKAIVVSVGLLHRSLGRPVTAADIVQHVGPGQQRSLGEVDEALDRLSEAGVLIRSDDGYRCNF
jgi:hypothetical protein